MKRVAILLLLAASAAACNPEPATQPRQTSTPAPPPTVVAPATPEPAADGPCPYLPSAFVADANGQRVNKVRLSANQPHPACFFYRSDGRIQLTVWVYTGDAAQAKAVVDQAAPVATANRADLPGGWKGGAQTTDNGAVYAVAKDVAAVVVATNQGQTIKAKRVAEKAIAELGL